MVCNLHSHAPSLGGITDRSATLTLLDAPHLQSVGIHPWHASEGQIEHLDELAPDPRVAAIGEAGFDTLRGPSAEIQTTAFRHQALLAERLGKPLIIHCVKAWDALLEQHRLLRPETPWVIHGFRGNPQQCRQLLNRGLKISLGYRFNPLTAAIIPPESLFIETDDAPVDISEVAALVAAARATSPQEIMSLSAANLSRITRH